MTVRSFKHRGLKRLYKHDDVRWIPSPFVKRVKAILAILDQADTVGDLAMPGYRLHPLKGRLGCWSMRVSGTWRIVIRLTDGEAWEIDLVDYH